MHWQTLSTNDHPGLLRSSTDRGLPKTVLWLGNSGLRTNFICHFKQKHAKSCRLHIVQIRVASRAGFGLSLSKFFGPISGLHTKLFYNIQSNEYFLSWRKVVVLTVVTSVSEIIVNFLKLIPCANTAVFFCSLLGLVPHVFEKGTTVHDFAWDQSLTRILACFKKRRPAIRRFMPKTLS